MAAGGLRMSELPTVQQLIVDGDYRSNANCQTTKLHALFATARSVMLDLIVYPNETK